jgi:hypothetical protein
MSELENQPALANNFCHASVLYFVEPTESQFGFYGWQ